MLVHKLYMLVLAHKDGDVFIYVHNSLNFKIRPDLSISNKNMNHSLQKLFPIKPETQLLMSYTDDQMVK